MLPAHERARYGIFTKRFPTFSYNKRFQTQFRAGDVSSGYGARCAVGGGALGAQESDYLARDRLFRVRALCAPMQRRLLARVDAYGGRTRNKRI